MIKQTAAALTALALSLPVLSETPAEPSTLFTPAAQTFKAEPMAAPAKKVVKTIDFTKPNKNEPLFAEVVEPAKTAAQNSGKRITAGYDFTQTDPLADPLAMVDFGQSTAPSEQAESAVAGSKAIAKAKRYTVRGKTYQTLASSDGFTQEGKASWYGPGFHGRKTASGEIYNMNELTAAHKRLPLGTRVQVTNLANGKSVVVRITDRGPFHGNRVIDLSKAAAKEIGVIAAGTADVSITALK